MEKKVDIDKKSKIRISWKVNPANYTKEGEQEIITLMAKKYDVPVTSVSLETYFNQSKNKSSEALNEERIESILDPRFQQTLFPKCLEANGIKEYDINKLIEIDTRVNSLVNYDDFNNGKRWSLNWIKFKNFLSFGGDNYFDYTKLHGLVQLKGSPANESGKTVFADDLLHFLFYGRVNNERAKTMEQLFNNYLENERELFVEGCITIDGEKYVIKRTLTRKKKNANGNRSVKNEVNFYKLLDNDDMVELNDESSDSENLEGESTTKTTKFISEAIGSEEDFDMIISANSRDLDNLISMKDTERGKTLIKWTGLGIIEEKANKANEIYKSEITEGKRLSNTFNAVELETKNEELLANNDELTEIINGNIKKIEDTTKSLNEAKEKRDNLLISKKPINTELSKLDLKTLEDKINVVLEKGKKIKNDIDSVSNEINEIGETNYDDDSYKSLISQKEELISLISKSESSIQMLKDHVKHLNEAEICPYCKRKLDNVDNSQLIAETNDKIKSEDENLAELKAKKDEIIKNILSMDTERAKEKERNKLELSLSALNENRNRLLTEYKDLKQKIDELNKNRDAIKENNEIDAKINLENGNISTLETTIRNFEYDNMSRKNTIANNINEINKNKQYIIQIKQEVENEKNWNLYKMLMGKDGISKLVLNDSIPMMNSELKRFLQDCTDFDVEISMNDKRDVEFSLVRDNVKTKLSAASGLERTTAALALRVVLAKMSNLSRPPFILLDEILGTVAKENYDNVKNLFDKLKQEYDFVLHITHLEDISDWHDGGQIIIEKVNNISHIKQ